MSDACPTPIKSAYLLITHIPLCRDPQGVLHIDPLWRTDLIEY